MKRFLIIIILLILLTGCGKKTVIKNNKDNIYTVNRLKKEIEKEEAIWYYSEAFGNGNHLSNQDKTLSIKTDKYYSDNKKIYFISTIDIADQSLKIVKESDQPFKYNSTKNINFEDLVNTINNIYDKEFIIDGFLVINKDDIKIFQDKNSYKNMIKNSYFNVLFWNDYNYTGVEKLKIKCHIKSTYQLDKCLLLN